ncbi:winged helix-turn-helix domain-containing protein [Sphingomonas sp. ZT3P38]|uniref:winged helix-turn-helix domain-containing protein n=1 Tax=Parasphingomonas zepuensis TaxID=3096161 RepID=UPI002FCB6332
MIGQTHRIGSWQFDAATATLRHAGVEKSLEDRSARVLELLCRRRGETVSKDELLREVWQGRIVSPNSVAIVIGDLRRALGDDPTQPAHIVTVGKRGYRLTPTPEQPAPGTSRSTRRAVGVVIATIVMLVAALALRERAATPVDLAVAPVRNETGQARYDDLARSLTAVVTDCAVRFRGVRVLSGDAALPDRRIVYLNSRLILWNGAPELAITATDASSHSVLWSGFAKGDSGNLARDTAERLDGLQERLARRAR